MSSLGLAVMTYLVVSFGTGIRHDFLGGVWDWVSAAVTVLVFFGLVAWRDAVREREERFGGRA